MNILSRIFPQTKSVPVITFLEEGTRDGLQKAFIPKFLYKPPFGYPRVADIAYVRYLAKTPYVDMCITTITDEIMSIPWDIIPNPELDNSEKELSPLEKNEINHMKNFLMNPNSNPETFEDVFLKPVIRDVLEINSGVLVKVFNLKGEMVEVIARDGASFTKNPDIYGMFTYRSEYVSPKVIVDQSTSVTNQYLQIPTTQVREQAAYFQYGWVTGPAPVPFGRREIVWYQKNIRSDDMYGYSPVQLLYKNLQMLIYALDSDLEYFNNNNVPKGIIGLEKADGEELKAFKAQWTQQQYQKDEFGKMKKIMNKVPIMNIIPKFERIEFSATEMQFIEKQRWYTKMVWATFGVTSVELGYTEDAAGSANQIVQSKVFKKKAINPMIRLLERRMNKDILSEFDYTENINIGKGKPLEVPRYVFKFQTFDVDDERNKYELFNLQVLRNIRTINEIRTEDLGMEPVDWGDEPISTGMGMGGSSGGFNEKEKDAQNTDKNMKIPKTQNPTKKSLLTEIEKEMEKRGIEV